MCVGVCLCSKSTLVVRGTDLFSKVSLELVWVGTFGQFLFLMSSVSDESHTRDIPSVSFSFFTLQMYCLAGQYTGDPMSNARSPP